MRDIRERHALGGVLLAAALALVARLYALGWRTAHWDEGRVAHEVLAYARTGQYHYRPIVHGPFLFQVNSQVFALLGASDFTARLVVALVGGLLPLTAWLLRDRLERTEVVALALFLAANPILLYYSRFMRNDLLVGAFAFAALAAFVRAIDAGERRYVLVGAALLGLAFTTKENAVVYVGMWVGALALTLDHRLRGATAGGTSWLAALADEAGRTVRGLWGLGWVAPVAVVEFVLVVAAFYAPRPELWTALTHPLRLPGVLEAGTVGAWQSFWGTWVGGGHQDHAYLPFLRDYLHVLRAGSLPLVLFGVAGFVADRYAGDGPRDLVAFCGYWGLASVLVYPLVVDISPIPWAGVHAVVPLAVPAAVGVGLVFDRGRRALLADDRVAVGLAAVVLLAVVAQVGVTAASTTYRHPQDPGPMVQYGQPDDDLKPVLATVERVVREHDGEGPDVLYYGSHFAPWTYRLPLPWYMESYGANATQTADARDLNGSAPPVVIAPAEGSARIDQTAADVRGKLDGYREFGRYAITLEIPGNEVWVVVFVDEDYLE